MVRLEGEMYGGDGRWLDVDTYFAGKLTGPDAALDAALAANAAAGLPPHDVSPLQGRFLALMARLMRAERILEIGTLGGYSTIWMARVLPQCGRLITLERSPEHAAVANQNLERAGVSERVEIMVGPALDSLARLHEARQAPFDLIFIDADKPNNRSYLEWSLKLARPGSLIIADNVVRDGAVADAASRDPSVQGVRTFTDGLSSAEGLFSTALQTVGVKGWDGMTLSLVESLDA